jgi:hypothetical protein
MQEATAIGSRGNTKQEDGEDVKRFEGPVLVDHVAVAAGLGQLVDGVDERLGEGLTEALRDVVEARERVPTEAEHGGEAEAVHGGERRMAVAGTADEGRQGSLPRSVCAVRTHLYWLSEMIGSRPRCSCLPTILGPALSPLALQLVGAL